MGPADVLLLASTEAPSVGLRDTVARLGHQLRVVQAPGEALRLLKATPIDLLLVDTTLPVLGPEDLLQFLRSEGLDLPIAFVSRAPQDTEATRLLEGGAFAYVGWDAPTDVLRGMIGEAQEAVALRRQVQALRRAAANASSSSPFLGQSPAAARLLRLVHTVANSRAAVLVEGESGTGKELIARALHEGSTRRDRPFVRLSCAAIPESLVEGTLFGHERGASPGAMRRTPGAFERADGGTLLLDEISEMRLDLQSKLLRVVEELAFERVGGQQTITVDVRVVATSNRDLQQAVASGAFRRDLFYRLNVVHLRVPALRDRRADIPLLATTFLQRAAAQGGRRISRIHPETLQWLSTLPWPGNVRELEHAVQRAVLLADTTVLGREHFVGVGEALFVDGIGDGTGDGTGDAAATPADSASDVRLSSLRLRDAERVLIARAMQVAEGNKTRAAELLGISVRTLYRHLSQLSVP